MEGGKTIRGYEQKIMQMHNQTSSVQAELEEMREKLEKVTE